MSAPPTTDAEPHSGYRAAPKGSVSSAMSSSVAPINNPSVGDPTSAPPSVAATSGRESIAWAAEGR